MRAVNLIPPERRTGASVGLGRSQGGAYAVLVLVAVLALLVVLYGKARHQVSSSHSQATKLTAEAEAAQSYANGLARYNSVIAESQARTQAVEQLIDTRFDWARAFHELSRVLPKQVSINSVSGTISSAAKESRPAASGPPAAASGASASSSSSSGASPSPTGATGATGASTVSSATPPGSVPTFTLTGCATSQPEVAQMLQRLRLVEGVEEATLQTSVSAVGSAGGGGGTGSCPGHDPLFGVTVAFRALPAATPKSTTTVADTAATGGSR